MADKPSVASSGPAVLEAEPLDAATSFSDKPAANSSSSTLASLKNGTDPATPDIDDNPYAVLSGDLSFGLRPIVGRMAFDEVTNMLRAGYVERKVPATRGFDQESRIATTLRGVAGMAFGNSSGRLEERGSDVAADDVMGSHALGGDADEQTTERWLNTLLGKGGSNASN